VLLSPVRDHCSLIRLVLREPLLGAFFGEAFAGCTGIHAMAAADFVTSSACRGTRVGLRFAAPIQPERPETVARTK
jgi:hypothetical protein